MKTHLFFIIICVVATFAFIEAVPWYRHNPTKRHGKIESENNGGADLGVDYIGVNGGDSDTKTGGVLTHGDQNADENQEEGEGVDDPGGNGNQFGGGFQDNRGIQRGRGYQGILENSHESFGGSGSLGGRGYSWIYGGGRRNLNNGDDSGGVLTHGDQNADENQEEGEGVDDQGGNGNQFGGGFQDNRGIQRGRGYQGILENSRESFGGSGSLGGRGYSWIYGGGRRNLNNGDDSGGVLTRGDQNADGNQEEGEGVDDQGGNGNQFGGGFQDDRGIEGGYGYQGILENSRESFGGPGSLGGRGYPGNRRYGGGRRNLNNGDDSDRYYEDEGEGADDQGDNGNQFGGGFQANRGIQRGRGYQGILENSRESFGGPGSLGGRGYSWIYGGGRRNLNNGEDRREEDSESEDDSREYTRKPKHNCRGCRLSYIGNGMNNDNKVFIHED